MGCSLALVGALVAAFVLPPARRPAGRLGCSAVPLVAACRRGRGGAYARAAAVPFVHHRAVAGPAAVPRRCSSSSRRCRSSCFPAATRPPSRHGVRGHAGGDGRVRRAPGHLADGRRRGSTRSASRPSPGSPRTRPGTATRRRSPTSPIEAVPALLTGRRPGEGDAPTPPTIRRACSRCSAAATGCMSSEPITDVCPRELCSEARPRDRQPAAGARVRPARGLRCTCCCQTTCAPACRRSTATGRASPRAASPTLMEADRAGSSGPGRPPAQGGRSARQLRARSTARRATRARGRRSCSCTRACRTLPGAYLPDGRPAHRGPRAPGTDPGRVDRAAVARRPGLPAPSRPDPVRRPPARDPARAPAVDRPVRPRARRRHRRPRRELPGRRPVLVPTPTNLQDVASVPLFIKRAGAARRTHRGRRRAHHRRAADDRARTGSPAVRARRRRAGRRARLGPRRRGSRSPTASGSARPGTFGTILEQRVGSPRYERALLDAGRRRPVRDGPAAAADRPSPRHAAPWQRARAARRPGCLRRRPPGLLDAAQRPSPVPLPGSPPGPHWR